MARYVWNANNNIVALYGTRDSFRCRQRNRDSEGLKVGSFKFISYNYKNDLVNYKEISYYAKHFIPKI